MNSPAILAIVAGIDEYAAGTDWALSGPVNDAYEFTEWLRKLEHPTEPRIIAFVSPLNATCFHSSVEVKLATKDNLYHAIRDPNTIDACKENILIIFWGGHGVFAEDSTRRLFYADATSRDKLNLDLTDFARALRSDYFPRAIFSQQVIIVDACANYTAKKGWHYGLPTDRFPPASEVSGRTQFILLAASRGEGAANRKTEKTGVFSKELRSLLSDENVWPQDWKGIANRLCDRFETLSEARKVSQTPTYFRFLQDGEETRGYTSAGLTDPVNPRRRIFHIAASAAIFAWLCSLFFGEHITFAGVAYLLMILVLIVSSCFYKVSGPPVTLALGPSFESGLYGGFIGGAIGGCVLAIQYYLTNRGSLFISESELVWVSCMVVPYGAIVGTICGACIQLGFIWGKRMSIGGMRIGALIGSIAGGILGGALTGAWGGWAFGTRDLPIVNTTVFILSAMVCGGGIVAGALLYEYWGKWGVFVKAFLVAGALSTLTMAIGFALLYKTDIRQLYYLLNSERVQDAVIGGSVLGAVAGFAPSIMIACTIIVYDLWKSVPSKPDAAWL